MFVFHAADDHPPLNKLKTAYKALKKGHDWVAYKKYILHDLIHGRNVMFDSDSINWTPGNLIACKTESMLSLPYSTIKKGVDKWLFNNIAPTNIFYDKSDSWKTGFCTDGLNNISVNRKKNFDIPERPFFSTDLEIDTSILKSGGTNKVDVVSENVEFGYELLSAWAWSYKLYLEGRLKSTTSAIDTECLYWFSPKHTIDRKTRGWDNMVAAKNIPNISIHQPDLDWSNFEAPQ